MPCCSMGYCVAPGCTLWQHVEQHAQAERADVSDGIGRRRATRTTAAVVYSCLSDCFVRVRAHLCARALCVCLRAHFPARCVRARLCVMSLRACVRAQAAAVLHSA
jgi:hypothetical protein